MMRFTQGRPVRTASADDAVADRASRLWPRLHILGNPKSGSTFLFSCLRAGPFDPNLLYGAHSSGWRDGAYLLTTLGTKKEFNFFGGPGYDWGWEWYLGAPVPLSAWEWRADGRIDVNEGRRLRRGENGNGEPSDFVQQMCELADGNATLHGGRRRRRGGRKSQLACRRFPLECIENTPVVRPGCALVRPLPSRRRCGRTNQPACVAPKIYMSHAWPPVGSGTSPRALTLDPSINTFMSAPAAPEQLRSHVAGAAAEQLRFIILLRDPVSRAQSSARMMREWKWDKSANLSDALLSDLARLRGCSEQIAPSSRAAVALDGASGMEGATSPFQRAASELPRLSDQPLRRFRDCLAVGHPLNHVRSSVYAAAVLSWLSAGFSPAQFLWMETEAMRALPATELLRTIASFAGLPTQHLATNLPADIRRACESGVGGGFDTRMQVHTHRALPMPVARALQDAFRPFNELLRTLLGDLAPSLRHARWLNFN